MAKKKTKGININLLRGISGAKLAGLITLLIVFAAIPLTVITSQKQQNAQQEAATNSCVSAGGTCIDTNSTSQVNSCKKAGKSIVSGLCPGKSNIKCCLKVGIGGGLGGGVAADTKCKNAGGSCMNKYSCKGTYKTGLCSGDANNICCLYNTGTNRCKSDYPNGGCIYDYQPCKGQRVSNLCPGPSNYRCCTKI